MLHYRCTAASSSHARLPVQSMYGQEAALNASFAYTLMASDVMVSCGNAELAVLAGALLAVVATCVMDVGS
jgi:hypothetical protein